MNDMLTPIHNKSVIDFEYVFHHTSLAQLLVDIHQNVLAINSEAQSRLYKATSHHLKVGSNFSILEEVAGYNTFRNWFNDVLKGDEEIHELKIETTKVHQQWLRIKLSPILDSQQKVCAVAISLYDITVSKDDERRLAESEEKLKAIFESSYDALFIVGGRIKRVLECNTRTIDLFEITDKNLLIGKPINDISEQLANNNSQIEESLNNNNLYLQEIEYQSVLGKKFWGSTAISRIKIDNNRFRLIRITDITARKQIEAELLEANNKTLKLSHAKDEFLAAMSHEIRTPLNGIIGAINLLQRQNKGESNETLQMLQFSAQHLMSLINDILDINKIEAHMVVLESQSMNLNNLLESIVQTFKQKVEEKQIELRLKIDTKIPSPLMADSLRLTQVMNNLIGNAIKFTSLGEVIIRSSLLFENETIVRVEVSVTDTGIGIASNKLNTIFERFQQANSDTSHRFGGTGLGLTIVKQLLQLMGSDINVHSELGKGSCFSFNLTLSKTLSWEKKTLSSVSFEPFTDVHVLVAEDNKINQFVLCGFLDEWGVRYTLASNGQEALQSVRQQHFDLILMDLQMPILDGFEATKAIRELPGEYFKKVPIIALTAAILQENSDKIQNIGLNDYLGKPYEPKDLYKVIKRWKNANPKPTKVKQPLIQINFEKMLMNCKNNSNAMREYLDMYIAYFKSIKVEFPEAFYSQNHKKLSNWSHNLKPILIIAGVSDGEQLQTIIAEARVYLKEHESINSTAAEKFCSDIDDYCINMMEQLSKYRNNFNVEQ